MNRYRSVSIKSKWVKTKWLLGSEALKDHVPPTVPFSRDALKRMLEKYPTVYFKPTGGTGGFNIIRIAKQGAGFRTKQKSAVRRHSGLDALYGFLSPKASREPYLLQKGIALATVKGKPFDIRVMVQKSSEGVWTSTGVFLKIGKPGTVATNYAQGGKIGFLEPSLSAAGFSRQGIAEVRGDLERLGVQVGKLFDKRKKGFRELGLDVALDKHDKLWILEVNTRPQFYPLRKAGDRKLFRRILSFAKQYGRTR
ncbi:YheC/YheD family protein [Cohnella sp. AR92]|uniref:YheC/YheD family protein n=1 Tax=Cohnella sp. AR92 TaxID=648716 RepID=UPI001EDE83E4|nr:YheC/YheD family protein [Cohnella sp. AR92]